MALKVSQNGDVRMLDQIKDDLNATCEVGLFKSDWDPDQNEDFDFGDFTECDFADYARIPLSDFSAAAINGDGIAESIHSTLTWTFGGGASQDVYGIFVIVMGGGNVIYMERHPTAPVTLTVLGDPFAYTPKLLGRGFDAV